jgi:hypothetical protein
MPRVAPVVSMDRTTQAIAATPGAVTIDSAGSRAAMSDCFGGRCRQEQSANRWRALDAGSDGRQMAPLFCQQRSGGSPGCPSFRSPRKIWSGSGAAGADPNLPTAGALQPLERVCWRSQRKVLPASLDSRPASSSVCLVIIIQGLPVGSVGVPTFLQRRMVQTACFGQLHPQQLRLGCRGMQPDI